MGASPVIPSIQFFGASLNPFLSLLDSISKRPAMYVGKASLKLVATYLAGYGHAVGGSGEQESPLAGWGKWIESRFLISHSAWHWSRILLHVYENDDAAIKALPDLYRQFDADRKILGVHGIDAERQRRFAAAYQADWFEPAETTTSFE